MRQSTVWGWVSPRWWVCQQYLAQLPQSRVGSKEEGREGKGGSPSRYGLVGQHPRCLRCSLTGEMEPPQCVEELEDDVFQLEDVEPGTQPGALLSPDLFAQSQLDCPLSRLQLFPFTHCCGPGLRPTSQEDKGTQTLSPASPSQGVMLPCGVTEEPQRLFYGNAGYRLPLPASFPAGLPLGEQPPEGQWQHRAEVQVARKLQCIADQFHRLHMQRVGLGPGGRVCLSPLSAALSLPGLKNRVPEFCPLLLGFPGTGWARLEKHFCLPL
ncbi:bcl-2-modifying factor isoform X1 [Trichechus manatus latirostris]|uniref:Bcl-2-modifying factor isoform X1 n=1 Tax=Trichechus manatus latirostris TaxID=127582 RepID=A0A2Y9RH53_TRIMA|nr:bcl-2-modifying factor isoform X1 [Trichechus manatus latirostris]